MATITTTILNLYEAYNPILITVSEDSAEESTIYIHTGDGDTTSLTRVVIDGVAIFDISRVLASKFKSPTDFNDLWDEGDFMIFEDSLLAVRFNVTTTSQNTYDGFYPYAALNAVKQWGKPSDYKSNVASASLTFNPVLCYEYRNNSNVVARYYDYPIEIAFQNNSVAYAYFGISGSTIELERQDLYASIIRHYKVFISRYDSNTHQYVFFNGNTDQCSISIELTCTPKNPYYIRWINDLGGYDYKMFSYNRQEGLSVSDRVTIQRPIVESASYVNRYSPAQRMVGASPSQSITIVEENLSTLEFERLCGILKSPYVEHYNEATNAWDSLLVGEDSIAIFEPSTTQQTITIELIEPRPLLQF